MFRGGHINHNRAIEQRQLGDVGVLGPVIEGTEYLLDIVLVERLFLHQGLGEQIQCGPMGGEDFERCGMGRVDETPNLEVDLSGDVIGIVGGTAKVAAEEHLAVLFAELLRTQGITHAIFGDHGPGNLSGPFDVVTGAGGDLRKDQLLCGAPAEQHAELITQR